jgi:serine phosphatase RsbU (regulator of sigma subunit)/biotin operon repressor
MRADRLLSSLLLLQAHGRLTGRELAKRLEVSERTVHRDMEALSAAGVPVFALRGSQGGWQLDEEWRTEVPGLEESELQALLMTQPQVVGDEQLAAAAERALNKLMAALPASLRERATSIQQRLYVDTTGWNGTTENLSMLPIVQDAVWRDRKLAFRYLRMGREPVERTVDPLGLVVKGNTWYLFARTPDGFRTYRVSRIEDARLLDEPSERPANFDLIAHWKSSTERFQDEVSQAVEAYRRTMAEKLELERRTAQEMDIAKQVQARLFPQALPVLQTLDYAGMCLQARQVGGDYYDFLNFGQERLGIVISDIAGKGIAAALLMANLQANIRSQSAIASVQPARLLQSVNQLFYENTADSAYATLFFAEYDGVARRLRYANCGHLPALVVRSDNTVERLHSTCTVLGLFREWDCSISETALFSGDTLVLYTDGITESFNDADEEFGEQRLVEALKRHRDLSPCALLAAIVEEAKQFSPAEQQDDVTMIVVKCKEGERAPQHF